MRAGTSPLQQRLASSIALFHRALSSLRAASTPSAPLDFQLGFVTCRVEVLTVLASLVSAATSLSTSPPPAIAATLAAQSRDELQRCGRVTPQLRKVVKQLAECAASWARLAESSFDSDSASLALLSLQQQSLASLATWVEMVCLKSNLQGSIYTDTEVQFQPSLAALQPAIELQGLIDNVKAVAEKFRAVAADPLAKPISHLHTSCLTAVAALLTGHPLPYPRFFYQSLQQTRLQLAVSPQPRAQGESVAVNTSQYLAVKVEGVIQRSKARQQGSRQVAGVTVQLSSALQRQHQDTRARENKGDTSVSMQQEVEPHNDFFTAQFLVPFPQVVAVIGSFISSSNTDLSKLPGRSIQHEHQHRVEGPRGRGLEHGRQADDHCQELRGQDNKHQAGTASQGIGMCEDCVRNENSVRTFRGNNVRSENSTSHYEDSVWNPLSVLRAWKGSLSRPPSYQMSSFGR